MRRTEVLDLDPSGQPLNRERQRWVPAALSAGLILAMTAVAVAAVLRSREERTEVTIPAGTTVIAALTRTLSTETVQVGERVEAELVEPVRFDHQVVIADGATIRGEVTHAKGGGRIAGAPELTLRFTELEVDGERYDLGAEPLYLKGESDATESAAQIGGGAVAGGVVGAIAGGNVLKGAAVGAALGTGVAVATKGDQIVLATGQRLSVRLTAHVMVTFRAPDESDDPARLGRSRTR